MYFEKIENLSKDIPWSSVNATIFFLLSLTVEDLNESPSFLADVSLEGCEEPKSIFHVVRGSREGYRLVDQAGYMYRLTKERPETMYWRCLSCETYCKTNTHTNQIIYRKNQHSHAPPNPD